MMKKSIIAILAIVAAVGIVFAAYGGDGDNKSTNNSVNQQKQLNNQNNNSSNSNTTTTTGISASKAQEIAKKYIEEPGAKAGTPKIINVNGKKVYVVPVMLNGEQVGEIDLDAQTGKNLGGAGGAP
jgi:uncharacterized membrane protein YkoI